MTKHILLVDDNDDDLEYFADLIKESNEFSCVFTANFSIDAMSILQNHTVDCVLLDFNMPEINGLDFLDLIFKEKGKNFPCFVFTGEHHQHTQAQVARRGAVNYLRKSEFNLKTIEHIASTVNAP